MRGTRSRPMGLTSALTALVCTLLALHIAQAHVAPAHTAPARVAPVRAAVGHRADIHAAALASSADAATLTLELDRTTNYRLFTLDRPDRVVLDLGDSRFAPGAHLPHAGGIVQQLRAGSRPHGGLRIVLQLDSSATSRGRVRLPVHAHWRRRGARGTARLIVMVGEASPQAARRAAPAAAVPAPHAPALTDRDVVIAVDAGHGGQDPGAIGRDGTEEKNVTLAIARALAARIDAEPGMRAVLTRDGDVFLALRERMQRAREAHADLFVSVHADSIHDPTVSGASVYVLSERGATDEAARWLADRENAADALGGVPLADKSSSLASVLLDLSQTASISASMTAAQRVLTALDRVGEVRKARVQQAGFVVLKSPYIPSMLVETAYISNPGDERRLRTAREQRKLADAIFSGLLGYFEEYPPSRTRFARLLKRDSSAVFAGAPGAAGSAGSAGAPGSAAGGMQANIAP
ncbi:MAG: N-acetylmuramoyl-L-alanine amidase [Steroidobacteraceae bacterium]